MTLITASGPEPQADAVWFRRDRYAACRPFRILLLKPYRDSVTNTTAPPLGLLYLVAALREAFGAACEIRYADLSLQMQFAADVARQLPAWQPDVIGVSALNCEAAEAKAIAALAKAWNPDCLTVLGGPYALHNSEWIFSESQFDWVIEGSGERVFIEALARHFRDEAPGSDIPGYSWRCADGRRHITRTNDVIRELDALPMPAWDLVDFDGYGQRPTFNGILKTKRYATLFTSRGCPYLCSYCHDVFSKRFVHRSAEHVLAEIAHLHEHYGIREFQIVDDIFNLHKPRLRQIMREVRRRWKGQILFAFPNGLRADILDEETIDALVAGGTYSAAIAIETATPRLQKLIEKHLDPDKAFWAIRELDSRGVAVTGFFMLGFPTETPAEMEATVQFALRAGLTQAYFFRVVPQPETPLYELAAKENLPALEEITRIDMEDGHYRSDHSWYERSYGFPLNRFLRRANRRFYFRPQTVYRILRHWPLWSILKTLPGFFDVAFRLKWKRGKSKQLESAA